MKHASTKNTGHARGNAEKGKKVPPFAGASILNDKKDVKRLMQAADLDGPLLLLVSGVSRALTGAIVPVDDAQGYTLY